jgi:hypothetical protein
VNSRNDVGKSHLLLSSIFNESLGKQFVVFQDI